MPDQASGRAQRSRDSIGNVLVVAIGLSLVCSVLVSATAVVLKPLQVRNAELNRQQIILEVAGLMRDGADVPTLFEQVEPRIVDLESGNYAEGLDPVDFDALAAAADDELGVAIPRERDIANIKRRSRYALVYQVRRGGLLDQVILPVHGYGLWSTMYGYLSLERDANTVRGLRFYEHAETPGLGDQIDNPRWRALWVGKRVYGPEGKPRIEVIKGAVDPGAAGADYAIDGLAGATLTSRGVTNLMHYWLGEDGYGPYLARLRETGE